jgi:hypothetical protein
VIKRWPKWRRLRDHTVASEDEVCAVERERTALAIGSLHVLPINMLPRRYHYPLVVPWDRRICTLWLLLFVYLTMLILGETV